MGNVQQQVGKRMVVGRYEVEAVQYLGEGGSSFIFLVKDVRAPPNAKPFVLKRLVAHNEQTAEWIASEVRLHQRLGHPQVVQFVASQTNKPRGDKSEVFILMEYCPGGNLQENMLKMGTKRFAQHELLRNFKSLCEPVAMLHAQKPPIAHRDLKLENFLLDKEGVYKLCDFGSCVVGVQSLATKADRMRELDNVSKRTTAMYRSPELADVEGTAMFGSGELTEAVDVWAMGCILYSMAFFKSPFPLEGLRTDRYTIPPKSPYSPDVHVIIARMLTADVEQRARIEHIMDCIDEVICGRPLPLLPGASQMTNITVTSQGASAESTLPSVKTEARKEATVADKTDLLRMDFNPTLSSSEPLDVKTTPVNPFDTTWTSGDNFANFATFPLPSHTSKSVFASEPVTSNLFTYPSPAANEQVSVATPTVASDVLSAAAPSMPIASMKSFAAQVDPFAELDTPSPALLYGGMPGQRMGQHQTGQQHVGFQQPQPVYPRPPQMPHHMWGGSANANQGYRS